MSKMSKKLLYWDISHLRITLCIIIQTIRIKKYFELMLWITWNFELKPCINLNYNYFELDNSEIHFELVELRINSVRINRAF